MKQEIEIQRQCEQIIEEFQLDLNCYACSKEGKIIIQVQSPFDTKLFYSLEEFKNYRTSAS